jgi:hypothetical protein
MIERSPVTDSRDLPPTSQGGCLGKLLTITTPDQVSSSHFAHRRVRSLPA